MDIIPPGPKRTQGVFRVRVRCSDCKADFQRAFAKRHTLNPIKWCSRHPRFYQHIRFRIQRKDHQTVLRPMVVCKMCEAGSRSAKRAAKAALRLAAE